MNSHKTAISRTKLSKPMHLYEHYALLLGEVLDYGCGKGKDVELLGFEGYDPHFFPELPTKWYDTVTMNYVLNTITTPVNRMNAIKNAWHFVKEGGVLIVTARKTVEVLNAAKKGNWPVLGDGYITGKKTFQKGFSDIELEVLLNDLWDGMVVKSPVKTSSFSHAIVAKRSL